MLKHGYECHYRQYGTRDPCFNLFIACCSLHREAFPGNADIAVSTVRDQLSDDVYRVS